MIVPCGRVNSQGPRAFLLGAPQKAIQSYMQKNNVDLPPESDALFCPNGTNKDLKKLPWPSPRRREWTGRCWQSTGEGWSGCAGQGGQLCPGTSRAGDVRLLFKERGFSPKRKENTLICLPGTLRDEYGEGRVKRKKKEE